MIDPAVVGLTTIVLEHTRVLGDSLAAIAHEKAGIIKPGVPLVAAAQSEEALSSVSRGLPCQGRAADRGRAAGLGRCPRLRAVPTR